MGEKQRDERRIREREREKESCERKKSTSQQIKEKELKCFVDKVEIRGSFFEGPQKLANLVPCCAA